MNATDRDIFLTLARDAFERPFGRAMPYDMHKQKVDTLVKWIDRYAEQRARLTQGPDGTQRVTVATA